MSSVDYQDMKKLRWRCRRGTLELDLMLLRYLDSRYSCGNPAEQQAFQELLGLEDTELMRYLMGEQRAHQPAFSSLIEVIRTLPAI